MLIPKSLSLIAAITVACCGCGPQKTAQTTTTTTSSTSAPGDRSPSETHTTTHPSVPPSVVKLSVGKEQAYVNLLPKETPPIPKFPELDKKAGILRGYVMDPKGNPLQGAYIGVRSTLIGGRYTGASAQSDEKGYYEVKVPQGVAHLYAAGITIDYAEGRAAVSLHPAKSSLTSFASADGAVENFVLWTYGVADRDKLSENPKLSSNFYGGSLYVGHFTAESDDESAPPSWLRTGTEIEITLTSKGKMLDGSVGKTFVVKKAVFSSGFWINNIPVGQYDLTAKRADGQPLRIKLNKPKGLTFGIIPEDTTEKVVLSLYPGGAKAEMVAPGRGNWESVEIYVEIPTKK